MTTTQALESLIDLTQKNLDILNTINEAFYSKHDHISTSLSDGTKYTIPSFIHLENRINHLQEAFTNLVHAPASGEAWYNFDGNSKSIEIRGYQLSPNPINILQSSSDFRVDSKVNIFKDFLTPVPYYRINLHSLPDDISEVLVKKVVIYEDTLLNLVKSKSESGNKINFETFKRDILEQNGILESAYSEINTRMSLPLRSKTTSGTFTIKSVVDDFVSDELDHIVIFDINEAPVYKTILNGYSLTNLSKGDQLVTFDGSAKMTIVQIDNQRLKCKVNSAEYLNLKVGDKINFFKSHDFTSDKYIDIPLEEDRNVLIFVAPINSRMRITSEFGTGILLDTYNLTLIGDKKIIKFEQYYKENVRNIGDILYELVSLAPTPITQFSKLELNGYLTYKPVLTIDSQPTYKVSQINQHMNSGEGELKIKELYGSKKQKEIERNSLSNRLNQLELDKFNLSDGSTNTTGDNQANLNDINTQIENLRKQITDLDLVINSIFQQIKQVSTDVNIGLGLNKYHIRGYVDINKKYNNLTDTSKIIGIECLYRYKHPTSPTNNTLTINIENESYLCTEWNLYCPPYRNQNMVYNNDTGKYDISKEEYISDINNIKFNQLDIPITQGESVDLKVRYVYEFGQPFIRMYSDWSDIVQVDFPDELKSSPHINEILNETQQELKKLELQNLLEQKGVLNHFSDEFKDYDSTFHHRAENISSGFFTEDRKVISVSQKLNDLVKEIQNLKGNIEQAGESGLQVSFVYNNQYTSLSQYGGNVVGLPSLQSVISSNSSGKDVTVLTIAEHTPTNQPRHYVFLKGYISVKNAGSNPIHLYPVLPNMGVLFDNYKARFGNKDILFNSIFTPYKDLANENAGSMQCSLQTGFLKFGGQETLTLIPQTGGQWFYFNERSPYQCVGGESDYQNWLNGTYGLSGPNEASVRTATYEQRVSINYIKIKLLGTYNAFSNGQHNNSDINVPPMYKLYAPNGSQDAIRWMVDSQSRFMFAQPIILDKNVTLVNTDNAGSNNFLVLNGGEEIKVPLLIFWTIYSDYGDLSNGIGLTFRQGFTIKTSLYGEPKYYDMEYRTAIGSEILTSTGGGNNRRNHKPAVRI